MKSFMEDKLEWGEDTLQKQCRLTPNSVLGNDPLFDTKLFVLEGSGKLEKFNLWLKEYNKNAYSQDDLLDQTKYNALLELAKNNAKILTRVAVNIASIPKDDIDQKFISIPIK